MTENWVRLPLENAHNVRDLGGIPVQGGGQTAWRAFLRADDISKLSESDVRFLLDYGVTTVIDLRGPSEVLEKPDRLNKDIGVENHNFSFMENVDLSPEAQLKMAQEMQLGDLYVDLLKRKEIIRGIFEAIADAAPGCVLFHCAGGKDRTGVLAMLLLMLAGADKQDCQNNYSQTYINLTRDGSLFENTLAQKPEFRNLMESRPEYIEAAYQCVQAFRGGIEGYLQDCGVCAEHIRRVKNRLSASEPYRKAASY